MQQFMWWLECLMAVISIETLVLYDFTSICRIMNKEEIVEKIWNKLLPNKEFNEKIFYSLIRPIFLQISFITFLLSFEVLSQIRIFNVIITFTPILAILTSMKNINKK